MRAKRILVSFGLLGSASGCHLGYWGVHNLVNEPAIELDNCHITHLTRSWAKEAYSGYCGAKPSHLHHDDFAAGFVDGYSDYLDHGGSGQPPAVPPGKYHHKHYLDAEGMASVERYRAGWHEGARAAMASGLREQLQVQVHYTPISTEDVRGKACVTPPEAKKPVETLPDPKAEAMPANTKDVPKKP